MGFGEFVFYHVLGERFMSQDIFAFGFFTTEIGAVSRINISMWSVGTEGDT